MFISSAAMAQKWISLGGSTYKQYYLQENSLKIDKNNGHELLSMTVQTVNNLNNKIVYNNVMVLTSDCKQKQGSITAYSLDGKTVESNVFALGGPDPSSLFATAICGTYHNYNLPKQVQVDKSPVNVLGINNKSEEKWHQIAISDKAEISVKIDSFILAVTKSGQHAIMVTGRNVDQTSKKVQLVNWAVTKSDCAKQQGKLITINIDGKNVYDNIFVFGSGSIASIVSEVICNHKI